MATETTAPPEDSQSSKFRKEVLSYLKKQDYGSVSLLGVLKTDQAKNETLANILIDLKETFVGEQIDSLGSLGTELSEKLQEINESAIMGSASDQAILLEQLKAFESMIPLLEESNDQQRDAKKLLAKYYQDSKVALKQNSRFYNRVVEGAKSMMPAASGFLTAMTSKSPIAGAMVNFALEKFEARGKKKAEAKENAFKALSKSFDKIADNEHSENTPKSKKEKKKEKEETDTVSPTSKSTTPINMCCKEETDQLKPAELIELAPAISESISKELEGLNDEELADLKDELSSFSELTEKELATIEEIKALLIKSALASKPSTESTLEAERRAAMQNRLGKGVGAAGKPGKVGLAGMFADFLGLADIKAAFDILKGAATMFFGTLLKVGKFFARFALPLTLAISIGKGLYDGIKKWQSGAGIWEAIKTGLSSTGDLLIEIFTFGHGKELKEWISEKGSTILDPIFSAYDAITNFVSDTMTRVMDAIQWAMDAIKSVFDGAVKLFMDVKRRGIDAILDKITGNDTSGDGITSTPAVPTDKGSAEYARYNRERQDRERRLALNDEREAIKADAWSPIDNNSPTAAATPELRKKAKDRIEAEKAEAARVEAAKAVNTSPAKVNEYGTMTSDTPTGFAPGFNWDSFKEKIGYAESGGQYDIVGGASNKFSGKYQMGHYALKDAGLLSMDAKDTELDDESKWLVPGGRQAFLNDPKMQEEAYSKYISKMRGYTANALKSQGVDFDSLSVDKQASVVASAHLTGPQAAAKQFAGGAVSYDQFGTGNNKYATLGAESQLFPDAAPKSVTQLGTTPATSATTPILDPEAIPGADIKVGKVEAASGSVKESETQARALVASKNVSPNITNNNVTQQTSNSSSGGSNQVRSHNLDPTLALQTPVLA